MGRGDIHVRRAPEPLRPGRPAGRNSFAFESTDDRFVVYLTQPNGTRIQATTEHGRFLDQVVERSAAHRCGADGAAAWIRRFVDRPFSGTATARTSGR
jgi:hypothetical protein